MDPGSRLYFVNLISALLITFVFVRIFQKRKLSELVSLDFLKNHFKHYWFHPSAQVDYKIYTINALIKVFLFAPVLGLSLYISMFIIKGLYFISPDFTPLKGTATLFFAATVFAFVWDDFLRFFHHYLMHRIGWMWQLHKTHHSAEVLTPVTLFRTHPLESLQASIRNALSFGVSGGVLMFLFSGQVELLTLMGINAFGFLFNTLTGNLRHSQIPLSLGALEHIFISPKQHQIHHSNQKHHFDKNYGVALSVWDKLFGSFMLSSGEKIHGYGVEGVDGKCLKSQLWPWSQDYWAWTQKKIKPLSLQNKLSTGKALTSLVVVALTLTPGFLQAAETECTQHLNAEESLNTDPNVSKKSWAESSMTDAEYFVEDRVVTLQGMNITENLRLNIPGYFRAHLIQPKKFKGRYVPALFAKPSLESKFMSMRYPFNPELYGLWFSGRLQWFDNEHGVPVLTLMIDKIWKKDPRIRFDSEADRVTPLLQAQETSVE